MMMMFLRPMCHYCSKHKLPGDMSLLSCGVWMCHYCAEWHEKALLMIGGQIPTGCQTCNRTYAEIEAITGPDVRFVAVPKDGLYQVQCGACADSYIPKRMDLIRGTQFAEAYR